MMTSPEAKIVWKIEFSKFNSKLKFKVFFMFLNKFWQWVCEKICVNVFYVECPTYLYVAYTYKTVVCVYYTTFYIIIKTCRYIRLCIWYGGKIFMLQIFFFSFSFFSHCFLGYVYTPSHHHRCVQYLFGCVLDPTQRTKLQYFGCLLDVFIHRNSFFFFLG